MLQEEYIKEEQKNLKNELLRAQEEVKRIQVGGCCAQQRRSAAGVGWLAVTCGARATMQGIVLLGVARTLVAWLATDAVQPCCGARALCRQPAAALPFPQAVPLVIGQFLEMVDNNTGIVGSTTGSNYHVRILSTLNRCAQGLVPLSF